ncbi:uncharacterized protein LOC135087077 [Ostrinia nubilalis]|uniref:uncharacterized protein LOC135087077 n=1 Tax=Ostrinia nubilalis TaxID=29057 RepID=UPI0030825F04
MLEAILDVLLMDTSADEDVCISKQLLSVGHADSRPDAATQRSDLYLFPQFAALESGATPNVCEIQTCLRDGIMLDYVEDYRRHVPACRPLHERPEAATSNESSPSPDEQPETSSASRALCDHPRARPIGPRDPRNGPCPRCCDPRLDQRAPFDPPRDPYNAPSPRAPSAPPRMRPLVPRNVRSASSPRPPILHPPRYRRKGSLEPYNATSPHCDGLSVDPWAPCDSPRGRPMSPRESRNAPSQLCDVPLVPRVALRSPRNAPSTRFNTPRVSQGDPRNAPRTRCDASRAPRADLLASQGAVPRHRPLDPNLSMRSSSSPPESTSCGRPPASEARPIPPSPPPFREALRAQYNAPNPRCDAPRVPRAELLASQGAVPRYRPPGLNQLMRSSGSPPESASSSDSSASEARPPPPSPPPFREALRAACNAPTPRSDVPRTPRAELLASQGAVSRHWPLDPNLSMHSSSSPPESTSYGEPPASEARSTSLSPPPFREALRTPYNAPNPRCDAPRVPRTEPLAPPSAVPRYQPPGLNRSMRLSGSLPEPTSCSFSLDSVTRPTLPSLNPSDEVPARSPPPTYGASVGLGASVLLPMVDCEIFQLLGMVNVSAARWYMSNAISRAMPTGQTSALPTASTLNLAPPTSTPNLAPPAFMPNVAMPASTLNVEAPEYQPAGERPPPAPF